MGNTKSTKAKLDKESMPTNQNTYVYFTWYIFSGSGISKIDKTFRRW